MRPHEDAGSDPSGGPLRPVAVCDLQAGMVVELVGEEKLWDVAETPWRLLGAGERLTVVEVRKLATGRLDRDPYEMTFTSTTGSTIRLEVDYGDIEIHVV